MFEHFGLKFVCFEGLSVESMQFVRQGSNDMGL